MNRSEGDNFYFILLLSPSLLEGKTMGITKEQFEAFQNIKRSGMTNMLMVHKVCRLAEEIYDVDLMNEEVFEIIKNYKTYEKKYTNEDK